MVAATPPELNRGDILAGRYQIEAVIGNGGSGRVLRAFDRVTRTPVALKILRPEFAADPVWTERFSRELRVGRQIQHPNVCRVFDIGDADGNRFLSMELATGGTVRAQMEPGAMPRSTEDRIADARALIAGVAALHAAGIVHRDIKPENILRMEDGRLIVSDFGLATDPGAGPATTVMIGTPRYMAPEVVMGDPANARSDVWALGVVLHEVLSGQRPDRTIIKRRRRVYTPPEVGSPKERRLVELSARCSDEDPGERPASAVEVAREFEAAVRGQRFTRAFVRKQVAWGAVAIAAIATLGLIRNRWTSRAIASSSQAASSVGGGRVLQPTGTPEDWGKNSTRLAAFEGGVHCVALQHNGETATVVWGKPRRAETIDVRNGKRAPATLLAETFESGCPQASADGRSLLFEKAVGGAQHIFLAPSLTGRGAIELVRGSAPLWLPNGQEFAFTLDSRHAAIFSVPTREMTVITDNLAGQFAIDDKAVDPAGSRAAVLYTTESFGSFLVVHALPGLQVLGKSRVPEWARNLRFSPRGDVLFTVMGTGDFRQLVSADSNVGELRRVASVPGFDIRDHLEVDGTRVLVTRKRRFDLWRNDGTGIVPLTTDGRSVNGSLSTTGRLLIQRALTDGREVIVLRDEKGTERQVTEGPNDFTPSFLPAGAGWLYVRFNSGELVECSAVNTCVRIHTDSLIPAYPVADPSGQRVAYITSLNASRVRVISRVSGEKERDLGPAVSCGPVWASTRRLWAVISAAPNEKTWAEIDLDSGQRTGVVRSVPVADEQEPCPAPNEARATSGYAFPLVKETSELIRTESVSRLTSL